MRAMRAVLAGFLMALLAGCAVPPPAPVPQAPDSASDSDARARGAAAAENFVAVVEQVLPVAEDECRARTRGVPCDFIVVVDDRRGLPPNAFQTVDRAGRPVIGFSLALIADARNRDELAFILGHEAAHHIAGHLSQVQASAEAGAILAGTLATLGGADSDTVRAVTRLGAEVGARTFSKEFELEADALGTVIAARAGFDPVRGAAFFIRIPDPGDEFLGTHPPNADRIALVRRIAAGL